LLELAHGVWTDFIHSSSHIIFIYVYNYSYLMVNYIVRQAKRIVVLIPGFGVAYISVRDIFPHIDKRLPVGFAVLITYILTAYVIIPAVIRVLRVVFPTNHVPLYCVTPDGFASDPLNIAILATRQELADAMRSSGWYRADAHTYRNLAREVLSYFTRVEYPNAPVSNLYLLGRKQDIAFEIPLQTGRGNRHHVRFWATSFDADKALDRGAIHWRTSASGFPDDERVLWLGAASLDVGVTAIRHNFQITHMIHPNTDQERNLIIEQLDKAGLIKTQESIKLTDKPYRLVNRAWRGYLESDGTMIICTLKAKQTSGNSTNGRRRARSSGQ
jgi:hypothetical protein